VNESADPTGPYRGLAPYQEADAPYFFGRVRERQVILDNLLASRLTLLYGPSGVGKSSVLRAGVVHDLRQLAQQNLAERRIPEWVVVVFDAWGQDPISALDCCIRQSVARTVAGSMPEPEPLPAEAGLVPLLEAWTNCLDADLLIILDQFEQYLLHAHGAEDRFTTEFARAVNRRDLRVNFLVSIREDALAALDRFKARIPRLFDNYLRIDHLDREAARSAIVEPIEQYNRSVAGGRQPIQLEPALVEAVLDQVGSGRLVLAEAGGGVGGARARDGRIEAPYLQLVMTRLWEDERRRGSERLRLDTLQRLGGAERIVRSHLSEALAALTPAEQDLAAEIFRYLVTPSGIKVAHTASDLASFIERPQATTLPILEKLSGDVRILVPVASANGAEARYTIFHDVLGPPVLEWLRGARERRRVARAQRIVAGIGGLAVLMFGLAVFAFIQRAEAISQQRMARSRELGASAVTQLADDVDLGLRLATEAMDTEQTPAAESALRKALVESSQSHVLAVYGGDIAGVNEASYALDGHAVATASNDGTVKVWDAANSQVLYELSRQGGAVSDVTTSPDGHLILTASGRMARLWDATTGQLLREFGPHDELVRKARFSPDAGRVVTASGQEARVWDSASGRQLYDLRGDPSRVWSATFSRDGQFVATANGDQTARVWDAATGQLSHVLSGHRGQVRSVAYSPDGRLIITASQDGTARIWEPGAAQEARVVLRGHAGTLWDARFSPDGKRAVTAGDDSTARVWDVATGRQLAVLRGHHGRVWSATYSADGQSILTASDDGTARLWDAQAEMLSVVRHAHEGAVWSAAFSPDGRFVLTAGGDWVARVWETGGWTMFRELVGHADQVLSAAYSSDNRWIATTSDDGAAWVWSSSDGAVLRLPMAKGPVNRAAFSPDATSIVTASDDGVARVWNLNAVAPTFLRTPGTMIQGAAFSPDGRFVVTCGGNGTVRVWDSVTGDQVRSLDGHAGTVWAVAYSPAGLIATVGSDRTARVWDSDSGRQLRLLGGHAGELRALAFSSDGRLLATAGAEGIARVWEAGTGKLLMELPRQPSRLNGIAFSPDDQLIATGSEDGILQVDACPSYLCGPSVDELRRYARQRARQLTLEEEQQFGIQTWSR
jgi:WD40 repeat protein